VTVAPPFTDLPDRDPGLPRFILLLACGAVLGAGWVMLRPSGGSTGTVAATTGSGQAADLTGGSLFVREGCGACHATIGPSMASGPSLAGARQHAADRIASPDYTGFSDSPDDYLREATLDHCVDLVPGYVHDCAKLSDVGLRLSDAQVDLLVAFIAALPPGGGD
jgi:hypothetical protein